MTTTSAANSTLDEQALQEEPTLLLSSIPNLQNWVGACPAAKTLYCWSNTLSGAVLISLRCKRWGCRHCGERKVKSYALRIAEASPQRMITLTVDPKQHETPRDAFKTTSPKVTQFVVRLRREFGDIEYFKVLEVTAAGWPHYHLLVRSSYIPQPKLSHVWSELTGAIIVDVRKIKRKQHTYNYVLKYLGKQRYIPWTDRRCSWSKSFFPPKKQFPKKDLGIFHQEFMPEHPWEVLERLGPTKKIRRISTDVFHLP